MNPVPRWIFTYATLAGFAVGLLHAGFAVIMAMMGDVVFAMVALLGVALAAVIIVLSQYGAERADRDTDGLLEPSNLARMGRGFHDLAARLGRAAPYSCRSCGAEYLSEGGQLVAGACPRGRKGPCPLEPLR